MHPNTIYVILKALLAQLTNRPVNEILAGMDLRADPPGGLGFTDAGLSALAQEINVAFRNAGYPLHPAVTPAQVRVCKTVADLFALVRSRIAGGKK
jgi:hypothetical protein